MLNTVAKGEVIPYVVPSGGVLSGGLVLIGSLVGVAVTTGVEDEVVSLRIKGVYEVPKITGAVTQGQALYHNGTASLTTVVGSNKLAGYAYEAALSAPLLVKVVLK